MTPTATKLSRRAFSLGLAFGLGACARAAQSRVGGPSVRPAARPAELEATANAGWSRWVESFQGRAAAKGIAPATLGRAFAHAGYLPGVVEHDRSQFHARRTLEDYIAIAASDARLAGGGKMLKRHRKLLDQIERRYGVQKEVLVAIWGMESSYGKLRGTIPVVSALSTLGYASSRAAFFEGQLVAALQILQKGDIAADKMTGSWAGAMGHTQFIPTTYQAYAVDFAGDGRRDIWSDDPTDALASAANYLAKSGWQPGKLWGVEVRLPSGTDDLVTRPVADWRARGVTRAAGGAVPDHGPAALILPSGAGGPAFLLFRNYKVLRAYNDSMKYALGVGHLSDRLAGGGPLRADFGPDAQGLTLAERKELQTRLTRAGFSTEGADGVIGDKTTAAIRAWEAAHHRPVTGLASKELLIALRG